MMHKAISWSKQHLFSNYTNVCITLLLGFVLYQTLVPLFNWLIIDSLINTDAHACHQNQGACWSFIQEKWRLILFGRYPIDEQWRPILALGTFASLLIITKSQVRWQKSLVLAWGLFIPGSALLMMGGALGLVPVETGLWGGLPLTLILSAIGIVVAYPIGILLALGRQSSLPIIKVLATTYIELIRGVPLITLLFMGSIVLPLFLPNGMHLDALIRAQIVIILFSAAYLAEVVRGGLQAIPRGQHEAAYSLSLSTYQTYRLIILPQALTIVIPVTVGTFIELFKDTSLVLIVSLMDLMLSTKSATIDAHWQGFSTEAYLFTGCIYFICCYSMSRYSKELEQRFNKGKHA